MPEFQRIPHRSEPYPLAFSPAGVGLKREISTTSQTKQDDQTLLWGNDNALPLRILNAVNASPTASSCLENVQSFITGSGFVDKGMEEIEVDDAGTTLFQYHTQLCQYMAFLRGFSSNFKYNEEGKPQITNAYVTPTESVRFKKPDYKNPDINCFIYNPYFGTDQYQVDFSTEYSFFDPSKVSEEFGMWGEKYKGQMYFWGELRPPFKFYPVPKYWSAEQWIAVDAQIQTFHQENLSNGFFQSVLLSMIGNPNDMSQDPSAMKNVVGDDNITRQESTKTVGQVFGAQMANTFSGVKKAGSVMTLWAANQDESAKIQAFPVNAQFDVMAGTFTDAIKGILLATGVDPMLLTILGSNGLANAGDSKRSAIELMQARAKSSQVTLEQFYNKILIPNHINGSKAAKVKIIPYSPITTQVVVEDKFWEFMNDDEKRTFITDNVPQIKIIRPEVPRGTDENGQPIAPAVTEDGTPVPVVNDELKNINIQQLDRIQKIVARYNLGQTQPNNAKALTYDQAVTFLLSFGISQAQIPTWLVKPDEL